MSWVPLFTEHTSEYEGYVLNRDQLVLLIEAYELETHSRYAVRSSRRIYNVELDEINYESMKIVWTDAKGACENIQPTIPDDGYPLMHLGSCTMECHHGGEKHKYKPKSGLSQNSERHRKIRDSKKMGCPSNVRIRRALKFIEYKLASYKDVKVDERSNELQARLIELQKLLCSDETRSAVMMEDRFYVQFQPMSSHENHPVGEEVDKQITIDRRLSAFIHEKVMQDGIFSSSEMKGVVSVYVREVLFKDKPLPPISNTRYWPDLSQIRNHIRMTASKQRDAALDQDKLEPLVAEWRQQFSKDTIELRLKPRRKAPNLKKGTIVKHEVSPKFVPGKKKFLFVQQTHWQRKLLHIYGDEICIFHCYKTSKHALPIFFLIIPTNCMFIVIATFILESEAPLDIEEALSVIKSWNPGWTPRCIMVDFNEGHIAAVENAFKDYNAEVLLCDFHRLEHWNKLISTKTKVGVVHHHLMNLLINVADAQTEPDYREHVQVLHDDERWRANKALQRWFDKWLTYSGRWVKFFRQERYIIVDTNVGMDKLDGIIKQIFLRGFNPHKSQTVSEIATLLITQFLTFLHSKYCQINLSWSSEGIQYNVPFLHNRPKHFVEHVLHRWEDSQEMINQVFAQDAFGTFHVMSSSTHLSYEIKLKTGHKIPSCNCMDWRMTHLPCKHMLAGISSGAFTWEELPVSYTCSPFLLIDCSFLPAKEVGIYCENGIWTQSEVRLMEEAENFRCNLRELENLSYLSSSRELFQSFNSILQQWKNELSNNSFTKESAIPCKRLEPVEVQIPAEESPTENALKRPLEESEMEEVVKNEVVSPDSPRPKIVIRTKMVKAISGNQSNNLLYL